MHKKNFVALAAGALTVAAFAGCANVNDQLANKMAENILSNASGGQVKIDQNGENISLKTADGEAVIGGGSSRPASAPADLPSLPNAKGYSWFGNQDGGLFGFTIENADYATICQSELALLASAGWTENKDAIVIEYEGGMSRLYKKPGFDLNVTCTGDKESKTVAVALAKSKSTDTSEDAGSSSSSVESSIGASSSQAVDLSGDAQ